MIRAEFRRGNVTDDSDDPRGVQLALLTRIAALYERRGLLTVGRTAALSKHCPRAEQCWRAAADHRPPANAKRSGIALPWVGPDYQAGGVVVVAINRSNPEGLLSEYATACETAGDESQLNRLAAGYKRIHRRLFAYRTCESAAVVQDWLAGGRIRAHRPPQDLVPVLKSIARLQAVKCAPDKPPRYSPTKKMEDNCPPWFLVAEFDILQPGAIITFGRAGHKAVKHQSGYHQIGRPGECMRGEIHRGQTAIPVFSLGHPAINRWSWDRSHRSMVRWLRANRRT